MDWAPSNTRETLEAGLTRLAFVARLSKTLPGIFARRAGELVRALSMTLYRILFCLSMAFVIPSAPSFSRRQHKTLSFFTNKLLHGKDRLTSGRPKRESPYTVDRACCAKGLFGAHLKICLPSGCPNKRLNFKRQSACACASLGATFLPASGTLAHYSLF